MPQMGVIDRRIHIICYFSSLMLLMTHCHVSHIVPMTLYEQQVDRSITLPVTYQYTCKIGWGYSDSGVTVTNSTSSTHFSNIKGGSRIFAIA